MIVRAFRILLDLSKSSEINTIISNPGFRKNKKNTLLLCEVFVEGSLPERHALVLKKGMFFLNVFLLCSGVHLVVRPHFFLIVEPCKTESDFLVTLLSYTKDWV